jgi:hypothetical protein
LARRPRPSLSRGSSVWKCYMPITARLIGFTARPSPSLFPAPASAVMTDRPLMLYAPASSFQTVCPPQSSFTMFPALDPKTESSTYQGFGPICGVTGSRPLTTRLPKSSLRSAHRLSQPSGGFLRVPAPRACFIPKPHPGFACPGTFPFARPCLPFGGQFLLAVGVQLLTARRRWPVLHASASRS